MMNVRGRAWMAGAWRDFVNLDALRGAGIVSGQRKASEV